MLSGTAAMPVRPCLLVVLVLLDVACFGSLRAREGHGCWWGLDLSVVVSDMDRRVGRARGLGGGAGACSRLGGGGRLDVVRLSPVSRRHPYGSATATDALDDGGVGGDRRCHSRCRTRRVCANWVLADSRSYLVIWPAAYQLGRPGVAPLGTKVSCLIGRFTCCGQLLLSW